MGYRGVTMLGNGTTAQRSTLGGAIPGQVGDKVLICVLQSSGSNTMTIATTGSTTPTLLRGPDVVNTNMTAYLWSMTLAAGDIGKTATATATGGGWFVGAIVAMSNAAATAPIVGYNATSGGGTSASSPSVTTTVDNSDIVTFWLVRAALATPPSVTVPGTQTKAGEAKTADAASPNFALAVGYRTSVGAAGVYGGTTATFNEATTGAIAYTVGITPNAVTADPGLDFYYVNTDGLLVQCSLYYADSAGTLQQVADRTK